MLFQGLESSRHQFTELNNVQGLVMIEVTCIKDHFGCEFPRGDRQVQFVQDVVCVHLLEKYSEFFISQVVALIGIDGLEELQDLCVVKYSREASGDFLNAHLPTFVLVKEGKNVLKGNIVFDDVLL
jgi:hypothetical protein